jgi:hypothetical protein
MSAKNTGIIEKLRKLGVMQSVIYRGKYDTAAQYCYTESVNNKLFITEREGDKIIIKRVR